jgi:hypothetical protein
MTLIRQCLLCVLVTLASTASASELEALPTSESGFQNRIQAQIKPGDKLEDALRLLESGRFECMEFSNKNPVFHCSRLEQPATASDGWLYQVMIEPKGSQVGRVSPSLGRMRR